MKDDEVKDRNLSITLALFPLTLLIFLLGLSVYLFGSDSSYGANQIALVMATFAAAVVGGKIGIPWSQLQKGILNGIMIGLAPNPNSTCCWRIDWNMDTLRHCAKYDLLWCTDS